MANVVKVTKIILARIGLVGPAHSIGEIKGQHFVMKCLVKHGKVDHHQLLTEDVGHPALAQHLHAVVTLMRVSKTWSQFERSN